MTTVLMTYVSGTEDILNVALRSLARHFAGCQYQLSIITDVKDVAAREHLEKVSVGNTLWHLDVGNPTTGSGQHGRLLDEAVKLVETSHFLTLDSDCFPVADGWLQALMDMQADDVAASGILWPWIPAPTDLNPKTIEWKIRHSHCWNNTQPACQLIRTSLMKDRGWKFADSDGYDTNCGFMDKAHAAGYKVVGLKPTRGPFLDDEDEFDPEMNRHESIIYGDMIYHHVGASREGRGETKDKAELFQKARQRVYSECGAEWMLEAGNSHVYRMDNEEEVAKFKMRMMYNALTKFLETNSRMFGNNWA